MKNTTLTAYAAAASADWSDAPPQAEVAPGGLNILFATSQIETTPKDAEADGAEAQAPSSITVVSISNGTVAGASAADLNLNVESGSDREAARVETGEEAAEAAAHPSKNDSETQNLAIAALENQGKSFPQIIHEILATMERQSILHSHSGSPMASRSLL